MDRDAANMPSCWHNLKIACSIVGVVVIAWSISKFVRELVHQRRFHRNKPGPPHSWLLGHIPSFAGILRRLPPAIDNQVGLALLHREIGYPPVFYLDLYPFADPLLVIAEPDQTTTITINYGPRTGKGNPKEGTGSSGRGSGNLTGHITQFPRHSMIRQHLNPVLGRRSVTMAKGDEWKVARGVVAKVFAPRNIARWTPGLVRIAERFVDVLEEHATPTSASSSAEAQKNVPIAKMHELCLALMLDMTCLVALGRDLGVLSTVNGDDSGHPGNKTANRGVRIMEAMETAKNWAAKPSGPISNMFRWPVFLRHCRRLDKCLEEEVEEFLDQQECELQYGEKKADDTRPISGLQYLVQGYKPAFERGSLNRKEYMETITDNIKALILGGHDTTASTLSYNYYLLSKNPSIVQTLRVQIDDVFGPTSSIDPDCIAQSIAENPQVLNTISILTPIIQETIRIFPPASAAREASPGYNMISYLFLSGVVDISLTILRYRTTILHSNGAEYPVLDHIVFTAHPVLGHSTSFFTDPEKFNPGRYTTTSPSAPGHADTESDSRSAERGTTENSNWRFFERGQRNCVGRELAMVMLKVAMIMTLGKFDFETAYDQQSSQGKGNGEVADEEFGGPAYQRVETFLPAPNGDLPMRIRKVST